MIGVAGHAVRPEAEDDVRPVHADRLDDPAHELVEIGSVELALRVVEHAHDAHAEDGNRPTQLVLAHGVEVAPGDRVQLDIAVLAARRGRLSGKARVEPSPRGTHDDHVRPLGCGRRDGTAETEGLVAGMGDHDHQAPGRRALPHRPPE